MKRFITNQKIWTPPQLIGTLHLFGTWDYDTFHSTFISILSELETPYFSVRWYYATIPRVLLFTYLHILPLMKNCPNFVLNSAHSVRNSANFVQNSANSVRSCVTFVPNSANLVGDEATFVRNRAIFVRNSPRFVRNRANNFQKSASNVWNRV